jgi:hypothetical protein
VLDRRILRASDGTCIRARGSKTTDWRVHAVYDLGRGGFSHLDLTDDRGAEAITRGAPIAGEIRIADRYFAGAGTIQQFRAQSANQADFIVRVGWSAFSLTRPDGKPFDLIAHLRGLPHDMLAHQIMLRAAIIGALTSTDLLRANNNVHPRLAHSPRRRKPHIQYPGRT